ncbi:hypothetical protein ACT453_39330 [Bacillus sp. D-CC]
MQGVTRNPLADAGVLGINASAKGYPFANRMDSGF